MPRSGISDHAVALISFLKEPPSYRLQWLLPGYVPTQSIAEIFSTMLSPKSVLVDFWGFFPQIKHTTKPTGLLPFLLLTCRSSFFLQIPSHTLWVSFLLFQWLFVEHKFLILNPPNLYIFSFLFSIFAALFKKSFFFLI